MCIIYNLNYPLSALCFGCHWAYFILSWILQVWVFNPLNNSQWLYGLLGMRLQDIFVLTLWFAFNVLRRYHPLLWLSLPQSADITWSQALLTRIIFSLLYTSFFFRSLFFRSLNKGTTPCCDPHCGCQQTNRSQMLNSRRREKKSHDVQSSLFSQKWLQRWLLIFPGNFEHIGDRFFLAK